MSISKELLAILVCPACKGDLDLTSQSDGLTCGKCQLTYPIQDNLPIMVADETTPTA